MPKIECIIGKIVGGFIRTEYLLSQIASHLDISKSKTHFFANYQTAKKINALIKKISNSEINNKELYTTLLEGFNKVREERNTVVHGLFLVNVSNENEYKVHSYLENKNSIIDKSRIYTFNDLLEIERKIIQIHNDLFNLHFNK